MNLVLAVTEEKEKAKQELYLMLPLRLTYVGNCHWDRRHAPPRRWTYFPYLRRIQISEGKHSTIIPLKIIAKEVVCLLHPDDSDHDFPVLNYQ